MHQAEKLQNLVIKAKEKRLPGIIRNTWEDNIKTYFIESVIIWNKFKWLQRAWKKGLWWTQC
jgi:hypothetical protein